MSWVEKLGGTMATLLFKLLFILLLIFFIVMVLQGILQYWIFVASMLVGMMFSPWLYTYIGSLFVGELPEICTFTFRDIGEAATMGAERKQQYLEELKAKEDRAQAVLANMAQDVMDIKQTYRSTKTKLSSGLYDEARGRYYSSRVRRALKAQLGDDLLMKHVEKKDLSVNWEEFL